MKKVFICILLWIFCASPVFAEKSVSSKSTLTMLRILATPAPEEIQGTHHYYSVLFSKSTEAIVAHKEVFRNVSEKPLTFITLKTSGEKLTDIHAYQVFQDITCIRYEESPLAPQGAIPSQRQPSCLEYDYPNYRDYQFNPNTYSKAEVNLQDNTVTIQLPSSIPVNGSGSILLYYRSPSYVHTSYLEAFNYTYRTLKSSEKLKSLVVGISVENGLTLKGGYGDGNSIISSFPIIEKNYSKSPSMDSLYQSIGDGSLSVYRINFPPYDNLTLIGNYASSYFVAYGKELSIVIFIVGTLICVLSLGIHYLIKHYKNSHKAVFTNNSIPRYTIFLQSLALSLLSSIFIFLSIIFLPGLIPYVRTSIFSSVTFVILIYAFYSFLFGGASIFLGYKYKITWGFITFGMIPGWIFIFMIASSVFPATLTFSFFFLLDIFLMSIFFFPNKNSKVSSENVNSTSATSENQS